MLNGFFARTPIVMQSEAAECGLACLAMIAGFHGNKEGLFALRRRNLVSHRGTSIRDLIKAATDIGLLTRAVRVDLAGLSKLRLPVVVHWNLNHFVVLTRVGRSKVTIHDPAAGSRTLSIKSFSDSFTGVALEAWPSERFERKSRPPTIRLSDLVFRTRGLGRAAAEVLGISLLIELAAIAMPIGVQLVLDQVVVSGDYDLLVLISLALALFVVTQVASTLARSWMIVHVGASLSLQWKSSLFAHLLRLPLRYFERRHVGDVVSRFQSLDSIKTTLTTTTVTALLDGLMSVALVTMMVIYGGWLIAIALVSVFLNSIVRIGAYHRMRSVSEESIVAAAKENSYFLESVRGIASVKALNLEERRLGFWTSALVDEVNANARVQKIEAVFAAVTSLLFGLDRVLLLYLGGNAIVGGTLSIGMLVAFLAYKDQFSTRVERFIATVMQYMMLTLHGERIADIALEEPERGSAQRINLAAGSASPERALELRNVCFSYGADSPPIIQDLSLVVAAGECVGIEGPSGAGKTTLMKLMAGLIAPTAGDILVNGVPVAEIGFDRYRHLVGCVLQDDRLFAGSIAENIAAFDPDLDPNWVSQCALMASVHDDIMRMPMGYETMVGDMGSCLSGGQLQRIVLARALYRRPSILLMDEATSHLDGSNEASINQSVRQLPMTRIIVAHRQTTLAMTDRVVRMG